MLQSHCNLIKVVSRLLLCNFQSFGMKISTVDYLNLYGFHNLILHVFVSLCRCQTMCWKYSCITSLSIPDNITFISLIAVSKSTPYIDFFSLSIMETGKLQFILRSLAILGSKAGALLDDLDLPFLVINSPIRLIDMYIRYGDHLYG